MDRATEDMLQASGFSQLSLSLLHAAGAATPIAHSIARNASSQVDVLTFLLLHQRVPSHGVLCLPLRQAACNRPHAQVIILQLATA